MKGARPLRRAVRETFAGWPAEIARPIVTNLLTAGLLFLVALLNSRFRALVFPADVVSEYPLICRAEPYTTDAGGFAVDVFIINRSSEDFSHDKLAAFLRTQNTDPSTAPNPEIHLEYGRPAGRIASAEADKTFNEGKGELQVSVAPDARSLRIVIRQIYARAVMKVIVAVTGLDDRPINRMNLVAVPLTFEPYLQDACYSRH